MLTMLPPTPGRMSLPRGAIVLGRRVSVGGGAIVPATQAQINGDGMWTWFTDPRAIFRGGATYVGHVNSSGSVAVTKWVHALNDQSQAVMANALQVNDHANPALCFLPDGRLFVVYSKHNDSDGFRFRLAASADSISSFSTETVVTASTPVSYSNPYYLSQTGKVYNIYRSGAGGFGTNPWNCRAYDVSAGTWDAERTWFTNTDRRPYPKFSGNGVDRIDILFSDMHPNQGASSIYHAYMQLDGSNNEKFYQSDGTLIGDGPIEPSDATLVYDGSSVRAWTWDFHRESGGTLHALFSTFPTSEDHRLRYAKCTAGTWGSSVEVAAMGRYLVASEPYYNGGGAIDKIDPTRLYVSAKTPSVEVWELAEYRTSDSGASWSKHADITTSSGVRNCRPVCPVGADAEFRVIWWAASMYDYYDDYAAVVMARA